MLVELLSFVKGWVEFYAKGKHPERFINLTSRNGINIWDTCPHSEGITSAMSISDYRRIRKLAKRAGVKTRVIKRHGLPFIANKYKARKGLLFGALAGLVITIVLSNFVWSVTVSGNETVSTTRLLQELDKNGVGVGKYKNNLNVNSIERTISLDVDEVGWMSINLIGSTAQVELKEKAKKPHINDSSFPSNLKATADGVITDVKASSGKSVVSKGSGVVKGQLLVSGILETKVETLEYVHSDGEIYADVCTEKEYVLDEKVNYFSFTENKIDRYRLKALWTELPCSLSFANYKDYICTHNSRDLFVNNLPLPITLKTEQINELENKNITYDSKTAERVFLTESLLYEAFAKPEARLISRNLKLNKKDNSYICKVKYTFNENIAENVKFDVTE